MLRETALTGHPPFDVFAQGVLDHHLPSTDEGKRGVE
jgi:hypothetical protein